jgi:hypothetical protein
MNELQEGNNCPLCGRRLAFSPLGRCECYSRNSHCPGYGPCKACEAGGQFCEACELFEDEIAAELERRRLRMPEQAVQEPHKSAGGAGVKPSPFHRTPPSTAVLAACDLWLPGVGGKL